MIASGNKGWFPYSNQCAKYFLEEICGFSDHVSDRQAFAGGGKSRPEGGRRNVDSGCAKRWIPACRDDEFETQGLSEVIEYLRPLETQGVTEVIEYPRLRRDNRISGCTGMAWKGSRTQRRRPGAGRDQVLFVFYRAVCHVWGYITLWLASPKKQTHSRTAAPRKTVDRLPTDPPHRRPYPTLF